MSNSGLAQRISSNTLTKMLIFNSWKTTSTWHIFTMYFSFTWKICQLVEYIWVYNEILFIMNKKFVIYE